MSACTNQSLTDQSRCTKITSSYANRSCVAQGGRWHLSWSIADAVLIDLTGVSRLRERERYDNVAALVGKVLKLIRLRELGTDRGKVSIRESTTLIFHSNTPETLWSALEPCVIVEPAAAGAIVTIRDGRVRRQLVVPMPASAVN